MKINLKQLFASISFKTAFACSLIILVLLSAGAFTAIHLQSGLADTILSRMVENEKSELQEDRTVRRESLIQDLTAVKDICAGVIPPMVYNFDDVAVNRMLSSYLRLKDLVAFEVLDVDGNPFGAAWKTPELTSGPALPDDLALDRNLSMEARVVYQKETVGTLRLFYTDARVVKAIQKQEERTQATIDEFKALAGKSISKSITFQVLVSLGSVLAMILTIVFCLKLLMVKPVTLASDMLGDIAQGEGDLTKRLVVKNQDEIGQLSTWFNLFVDKIRNIIQGISMNAGKLNTASDALVTVSDTMSQAAEDMSRRTDSVVASTQEMTSAMALMATRAEESASNINMVSVAAEEMTSTINEIAQNTEKTRQSSRDAVSRTHSASENVDRLSQVAQEIGKIVETINDISDQTNLLALNATIEAARAGEAGKGFAVVAQEIKELARQTAGATQEIKGNIGQIQGCTQQTVVEIDEIINVITGLNEMVDAVAAAVEQQSATTKDIAKNVSQAAQGIQEVSTGVSQTSLTAEGVAKDINILRRTSQDITQGSSQVRGDADILSQLAGQMDDSVGQFKI